MNKKTCAQIIRIVSAPPILITILIFILYRLRSEMFENFSEAMLLVLFLGIIPILAYPFQLLIPSLKKGGRKTQRKLAFIFSLIGYTSSLIWALLSKAEAGLTMICSTYCISVVLLTVCNKLLHIRASGHACSFTGPLLFLAYFIDLKLSILCIIITIPIIWSSLFLKRHTKGDITSGILVCVISFFMSYFVV